MTEDRKALVTLRCSMYRVAQALGLKEDIPLDQLVKECEVDSGWNKLGAQICCTIDYKLELIEDMRQQKEAQEMSDEMYARYGDE